MDSSCICNMLHIGMDIYSFLLLTRLFIKERKARLY